MALILGPKCVSFTGLFLKIAFWLQFWGQDLFISFTGSDSRAKYVSLALVSEPGCISLVLGSGLKYFFHWLRSLSQGAFLWLTETQATWRKMLILMVSLCVFQKQ